MSRRLDDLVLQIRDRSRWPPVPERALVPATLDDLCKMMLAEARRRNSGAYSANHLPRGAIRFASIAPYALVDA